MEGKKIYHSLVKFWTYFQNLTENYHYTPKLRSKIYEDDEEGEKMYIIH